MRKYLALARAEVLDALQEKAEIIIWLIINATPIFIMGSLWIANQQGLVNLNVSQLVTYYLIVFLTLRLTEFYFDEYGQEGIRDGSFSRWLVKPVALPFAFIPQSLGRSMVSVVVAIPIIIASVATFSQFMIVPKTSMILMYLVSLIITIIIRFSLSVLVLSGAFFWEQAEGLLHLRWIMEVVAGGMVLPIVLYPSWLRLIVDWLPFKYIYYVPASILIGEFNLLSSITTLIVGSLWAISLLIISSFIWKKGVAKYSSVGG